MIQDVKIRMTTDVKLFTEEHGVGLTDMHAFKATALTGVLLLVQSDDGAKLMAYDDKGELLGDNLYSAESALLVQDLLAHVFTAIGVPFLAISDDYHVSANDVAELFK